MAAAADPEMRKTRRKKTRNCRKSINSPQNSRRKDSSRGMEKTKKKMMILGASVYQVPLIRAAKAMGLYTLVASISEITRDLPWRIKCIT